MVLRTFEEKDAKSWDFMDLGAVLTKGKKQPIQAKHTKVIVKTPKLKQNIKLKLTECVDFSITNFEKLNKGFNNGARVNCFMNVCLQSLLACPGFFNLLQAINENPDQFPTLLDDGVVKKLGQVQKYLDSKH